MTEQCLHITFGKNYGLLQHDWFEFFGSHNFYWNQFFFISSLTKMENAHRSKVNFIFFCNRTNLILEIWRIAVEIDTNRFPFSTHHLGIICSISLRFSRKWQKSTNLLPLRLERPTNFCVPIKCHKELSSLSIQIKRNIFKSMFDRIRAYTYKVVTNPNL